MLQYKAFLIVFLPVCQKKHWYNVCTHIGMMLVAYNEWTECYNMWAHPKTKMLLCVHTCCYDIFNNSVTIWIQSSMYFGRTNNKGIICVHIMLWSVILTL